MQQAPNNLGAGLAGLVALIVLAAEIISRVTGKNGHWVTIAAGVGCGLLAVKSALK